VNAEVAIVGNGVAGYACAARLAGHGVRPLLVGRGLPVDRPPLTKNALARGEPVLLADAARLAERGVDRLDAAVDEADLAAGRLRAGGQEIEAGSIVLATGLSYRPPRLPGLDAAHVNATPAGMTRLAAALEGGPRRVAVVGGGLIGVETAATLAGAGHAVTILELLPRPLHRLHDPIPELAAATLEAIGVRFLGDTAITGVEEQGEGLVVLHDAGAVEADAVVAATGGRHVAAPGLVAEYPLAVGGDLRVPGFERVHAVGDLVTVPHARFGPIEFPHWDMAIGTGEHAADAIAGVAGDLDRLPYWWSDIGPLRIAEVGWAGAVTEWRPEDRLHVGRDAGGEIVCVTVVDEPRRLREARQLVLGA
jgi:3-phenylpropionate/trans-cinnamate dioxygenase ferredoxin reductase component